MNVPDHFGKHKSNEKLPAAGRRALAVALVLVLAALVVVVIAAMANRFTARREAARLERADLGVLTAASGDAERGERLGAIGGCIACHGDERRGLLAGGEPIVTHLGTFVAPNITSDPVAGIGSWSALDLARAMWLGRSPDDEHYYPAFPYTSYSALTAQDIVDLKAWLDSVPASAARLPDHDLGFPFNIRAGLVFWKWRYVRFEGPLEQTSLGEYLVQGPGHCAECHAPRDAFGGLASRVLNGNPRGPDGHAVPGILAADLDGWTVADLTFFLEIGMLPDGDFTGGHMGSVVEYGTSRLLPSDREAMAEWLLSARNAGAEP